jgi:hypothetical protein
MSEATITAPIQTPVLQAGMIVMARPDSREPRLAIVTSLPDDNTAQVIMPSDAGRDDLSPIFLPRRSVAAAPEELDSVQQEAARRLVLQLMADASEQAAQLRLACTRSQDQAEAARETIRSMRAYAIGKHLDGTICRDGLNEFLAAHDLELYEPRYTAQVTITVDVEVDDAEGRTDAWNLIREHIEVSSADDDRVQIIRERDSSISELELVPDEDD